MAEQKLVGHCGEVHDNNHMHLDLATLLAANCFVTATTGALLVFIWLGSHKAPSALWWGLANLAVAVATAILTVKQGLPDIGWRIIVAICLTSAAAMFWASAHRSHRPSVPVVSLILGPLLWVDSLAIPAVNASPTVQMALVEVVSTVYSVAGAWEMWRGRGEKLSARWPLFALFALDAAIDAVGVYEAWVGKITPFALPPLTTWYGLIYFETFLFTIGGAILVVLLERERAELIQKEVARADGLTGVANRRAFLEQAAQCLLVSQQQDAPLSLVLFDLDRFKSINDNHGHAAGDQVLRCFTELAQRYLRPDDLMGRLGGEEFAVVLPGVSPGAAFVIADRIRIAFSEGCRNFDRWIVSVTVSAGVATAHSRSTLDTIMQAADDALYRAKARGRNRVERAPDADGHPTVVRIA